VGSSGDACRTRLDQWAGVRRWRDHVRRRPGPAAGDDRSGADQHRRLAGAGQRRHRHVRAGRHELLLFNPDDPAYAGCEQYTFYRVIPPGFDLTQGISIGSTAGALTHDWGRKITEAHLEVYPVDPLRQYGAVRLRVDSFPNTLSPGLTPTASSDEIGHINLPLAGAPGTGSILGTARGADGQPMPPRSFKLDVFGRTDTGRRTGAAGEGGFMEYGFGGARIEEGTTDGSFATRPLYSGHYDIHVQRRDASYSCRVNVTGGALRFDLDFGKDRLGHPGCEPLRPLARTVPG